MVSTSQPERGDPEIMREAHRRFGDTFMFLRNQLQRDFAKVIDPDAREVAANLETGLRALALVHQSLGRKGECVGSDTTAYIQDLCQQLYEAYLEPRGIRFTVRIEEGRLQDVVCERLGLIVTELVMVAAMQTSRLRSSRTIQVSLERQGANWILHMADNGPGVSLRQDDHMELIRSLADAIGGEMVQVANASGVTTVVAFRDRTSRTEALSAGPIIGTTFSNIHQ